MISVTASSLKAKLSSVIWRATRRTKRLAVSDSSRLIQRANRYSGTLCQSSDATWQYVSDRYHLTAPEMQKLQNGDALYNSVMTRRLPWELTSTAHYRYSAAGDEETWRRETKREWEKYNFGAFGCLDCRRLMATFTELFRRVVAGTEEAGMCNATR